MNRSLSSSWDRTGAKQSLFDQLFGSRFPNTSRRYLHLIGLPSWSFFMVEMAMDGKALPTIGLIFGIHCLILLSMFQGLGGHNIPQRRLRPKEFYREVSVDCGRGV